MTGHTIVTRTILYNMVLAEEKVIKFLIAKLLDISYFEYPIPIWRNQREILKDFTKMQASRYIPIFLSCISASISFSRTFKFSELFH